MENERDELVKKLAGQFLEDLTAISANQQRFQSLLDSYRKSQQQKPERLLQRVHTIRVEFLLSAEWPRQEGMKK